MTKDGGTGSITNSVIIIIQVIILNLQCIELINLLHVYGAVHA